MNNVSLIGNLTRDPEHSVTPSGVSVCKFGVAVNRNYTNAAGEREADFLNIVVWRGMADNCAKYLHKGNRVAISGQIQTRNYTDKNGANRTATEIIADDVEFIRTDRNDEQKPTTGGKPPKQMDMLEPVSNDDLPF